ncbi:hypothetical protein H0H93_011948 [Arthromyces matolae]|nr:hypothetical protein H0H93_011948 [Arthromyces matolae]
MRLIPIDDDYVSSIDLPGGSGLICRSCVFEAWWDLHFGDTEHVESTWTEVYRIHKDEFSQFWDELVDTQPRIEPDLMKGERFIDYPSHVLGPLLDTLLVFSQLSHISTYHLPLSLSTGPYLLVDDQHSANWRLLANQPRSVKAHCDSKNPDMGRTAKYFTLAEKRVAIKQQRQQYSQTSSAQNHRTYTKQKELRASASTVPPSLQVPDLPCELYELLELPLPTSMSFKDAFRSDEWYDDSDEYNDRVLSAWDMPPPYLASPPENPHRFQDILLAYRLRKRKEAETARLERYRSDPLRDFSSDVHQELMACYEEWKQLSTELKVMGQGLEREFSLGLLRWRSQRVHYLEEDFNSLRQGFDSFLGVFINRWSAIR